MAESIEMVDRGDVGHGGILGDDGKAKHQLPPITRFKTMQARIGADKGMHGKIRESLHCGGKCAAFGRDDVRFGDEAPMARRRVLHLNRDVPRVSCRLRQQVFG